MKFIMLNVFISIFGALFAISLDVPAWGALPNAILATVFLFQYKEIS